MIEEKVLQGAGLNQNEVSVYLALLNLGEASVLQISRISKVKRPTCYLALESLVQKNFVTHKKVGNVSAYVAEDPKIVLNSFKQKISDFEELLPFFRAKLAGGSKPRVRVYEGKEAIWQVYTQVIFPVPTKEVYFFGSETKKLLEVFPKIFDYWFEYHFKNKQYKIAREIVASSITKKEISRIKGPGREIRVMPAGFEVFSDIVVTERYVFVVSLDNLFGILIESEDLAKTFKSIFNIAWLSASKLAN